MAGHRKQYSCDFCRTRKLRCDRPLPCTSCRSRGKTCHFAPVTAETGPALPHAGAVTPVSLSSPQPPAPNRGDLLAEIQSLRKLAEELEKRVVQNASSHQAPDHHGSQVSPLPSTSNTPQSSLEQLSDEVAHLQRVSMGQSSNEDISLHGLVFKIEHIRAIPQAPPFTAQLGKPTPCVWLPRHAEASALLECFITDLGYIQHVVHHPSLARVVDDAYRQIDGQDPLKPGDFVLLLSVIAAATHVWARHDDVEGRRSLFLSSAQANAQTALWIKATHAVLDAAQNSAPLALETVQGIIILSFVVCNLEGVSIRYRSLISTALVLGRELGLHRIDHGSNVFVGNNLEIEMGRRVWWYLVATDWLLAARYGGPGEGVYQSHPLHMTVKKPRNINDEDLLDHGAQMELPINQPTDMSYFLQRIRLAEISRNIVDANLILATNSGRPSYYAHIMAMDYELDQMIRDIPPFFQLERYERTLDSNKGSHIFIQAYMLNSLLHSQRCKLHLAYLTSGPNHNPAYASSRDTCLKSARQIIHAETQLLRSHHPFIQVRLRLAAILYSLFMASIILLMDACVNRPSLLQYDMREGDVAEALRILGDARCHSLAAAKLHESLMQISAKYRKQQQQYPQVPIPLQHEGASAPIIDSGIPYVPQRSDLLIPESNPPQIARGDSSRESPTGVFLNSLSATSNQQAESLDDPMYLEEVRWDDLFSGAVPSSFL